MSWLLRMYSAVRSAKNFKTVAAKTAQGVRRTREFAGNVRANHFSLSYERAREGNMEEQCQVAERYYEGRGIHQSFDDAALWFERAARAGHPKAQAAFAMMLFLGRGVSKDFIEAAKWIELAAKQDEVSALKTRERIFNALTREQLIEAQKRVENFKPVEWREGDS